MQNPKVKSDDPPEHEDDYDERTGMFGGAKSPADDSECTDGIQPDDSGHQDDPPETDPER